MNIFCYNYNPEDNPERDKCYIKVDHCATFEPTNGKCTECASTYTLVTVGETATQKCILTDNIGKHCIKIDSADKCIGYERYKMGEVDETELSRGAKEIYHIVCEKYIKYA